jgi:hypothetical protein
VFEHSFIVHSRIGTAADPAAVNHPAFAGAVARHEPGVTGASPRWADRHSGHRRGGQLAQEVLSWSGVSVHVGSGSPADISSVTTMAMSFAPLFGPARSSSRTRGRVDSGIHQTFNATEGYAGDEPQYGARCVIAHAPSLRVRSASDRDHTSDLSLSDQRCNSSDGGCWIRATICCALATSSSGGRLFI